MGPISEELEVLVVLGRVPQLQELDLLKRVLVAHHLLGGSDGPWSATRTLRS